MTIPAKPATAADVMDAVITKGDLAKLTSEERVRYYNQVCQSLGLNPLTKPFEYITLNGTLRLYALRTCADQLRKINSVSLEIVSREIVHDILTVHVRAKLPDGRADEDVGTVYFPDTLKGDARANAELKAVTKAKRRATLSICGLGWLDETEIPKPGNGDIADDDSGGKITAAQVAELAKLIEDSERTVEQFCKQGKIASLADLPASSYDKVVNHLKAGVAARARARDDAAKKGKPAPPNDGGHNGG
jgi:hypothetical protein